MALPVGVPVELFANTLPVMTMLLADAIVTEVL